MGAGAAYLAHQAISGRYRMVLFTLKDVPGVWPMVKHYFFFKPRPPVTEPYNPLQKLAYTSTVLFGVMSVVTGLALFNTVQFSWLSRAIGGYSLVRVWHFLAMCGFLAFIPGHLIMPHELPEALATIGGDRVRAAVGQSRVRFLCREAVRAASQPLVHLLYRHRRCLEKEGRDADGRWLSPGRGKDALGQS